VKKTTAILSFDILLIAIRSFCFHIRQKKIRVRDKEKPFLFERVS